MNTGNIPRARRLSMACATALGAVVVGFGASPAAFADSSAANIRNCADGDWCGYHRTVDKAWRHSPLKEINKENVKNLKPAWFFLPGEARMGMQSTPLVVGGTMYVSTTPSTVWALDAATGQRKWAFAPEMDEAVVSRSFFATRVASPSVTAGSTWAPRTGASSR